MRLAAKKDTEDEKVLEEVKVSDEDVKEEV